MQLGWHDNKAAFPNVLLGPPLLPVGEGFVGEELSSTV